MKKAYFEVEMRIGDFYSGDGKIIIEDDIFEGYIALDYITGSFKNGELFLEVLNYEENWYMQFEQNISEFFLQDIYVLNSDNGVEAELNVQNQIKEKEKQKEFDLYVKALKRIHDIPENPKI